MKRSIILLMILTIFSSSFTGCWDYMEYDNMVQVSGSGMDYNVETNDFTLTIQYISTTKQGQGSSGGNQASGSGRGVVHSANGKTFMDALTKLEQAINKKMFFEYARVIVLGNDLVKYKLLDFIDFNDRTPAVRNTINLAVVPGRAEDAIASIDSSFEIPSSVEIYNLITQSAKTGSSNPVTMQDFSEMLAISGLEATAPYIVNIKSPDSSKSLGAIDEDIRFDEDIVGDIRVKGIAVFKADKYAGWLNTKESRGFKLITGKNMHTYINSITSENTNDDEVLYYYLTSVKSKFKPQVKNGKPMIDVDIKIIANLRKYYSKDGKEILSPDEIKILEEKLSEALNSDVEAALTKCKEEFNSDIFGFGFAFFRKNTKLWRNQYEQKWDEIFPELPVKVNIKVKIINTGTNIRKFIVK